MNNLLLVTDTLNKIATLRRLLRAGKFERHEPTFGYCVATLPSPVYGGQSPTFTALRASLADAKHGYWNPPPKTPLRRNINNKTSASPRAISSSSYYFNSTPRNPSCV